MRKIFKIFNCQKELEIKLSKDIFSKKGEITHPKLAATGLTTTSTARANRGTLNPFNSLSAVTIVSGIQVVYWARQILIIVLGLTVSHAITLG